MNSLENLQSSNVIDWQALDGCPTNTCGQTCVGPSSAIDPGSIDTGYGMSSIDPLGEWR